MINDNLDTEAKFFRGLSDATRLSILLSLLDGEKAVSELVKSTKQSQTNVSNHLKCLSECGLVKNRREGKFIYYTFRDIKTKKLLQVSDEVIKKVYTDIKVCSKYK